MAWEIARADSVVEAAETLGILVSTARTHLHRIFDKTETRRQAELVKLIERLAALREDKP